MILCDYLREKQRIIILFIIIISSWLIFPSLWIEIINNLLVNPILSKMGGTTILYDCLFGLIGLFSIIYSLYACRYKKQINYNNIMLVIFLTIGYSYFRFVQVEKWEFFTTATFPNIFYSDVFFILIITQALMLFAVKYKESKIFRDPQLSIFQVDNINTIIDKYKRNEYIDLLGRELCKSFYPNSAFSIIIDGDWGSGKSYFLETLKNNVSNKNKDILLIDFKPWFCKTPNEIIDEFFKQYKRELNKYDSSLSSNIKSYSSLLITDSEGVLDKIISSFGLFTDSLNIQSEYNEIHSKLVRLKQEVIIFIDDLDRLDENEIVEVLRLIRNTANFPYTQFIVAADKDYIQAALESKNISNPIKYLDKIFNMDISLPKFEEKVICEELASELQKFFQEEFPMFSNTKIDDIVLMCIKEDNFDNYNLVIPKILKTMRDVKRFLNQYKINLKVTFEKINKKERLVWKYSPVNIYNFFILELIKYRFYMLLFDECDKIIKDISYRSTIAFPIEDFFLFENKAFVSATPILPSDPRFQNQNFEVIKIKPLFNYKKNMQLVTTNNVVSVFRKLLEMSNSDKPLCIFLNSTDTIYSIIDKFGLKEQSQVFCSKDSVDKLKQLDRSTNAYPNLILDKKGNTKLYQYNFFTSRFFSAVDIDLEIQPIVVIISDLFYAKHSMIDPETESIQIIGRFRNGVSSIIHLSNTNSKLISKTPEQLTSYLDGCHEIYIQLKTLFRSATEEGIRDTLKEALERVTYSQYIDKNGNRNHFAIDNYFDEEKVKGYYIHPSRLLATYKDSPMFTVSYQHIDEPLGDNDRLKITRAENKRERRLIIIEQLNLLNGESGAYDEPLFKEFRDSLHKQDALIVETYEELGEEFAVKNITSDKTMRLALIKYRSEQGLDKFAIMSSVYAVFSEGKKYTVSYIRKEIRNIYSSYGDSTEYQATKVKEFFQVDDKIWLKRKRAYFLIKKLY